MVVGNSFAGGLLTHERLIVGVAIGSELCQRAQRAHHLGTTSALALGRLMIATVLVARTQRRTGSLSLQVLGKGRIRQVFADINDAGDMRGFIRPPDLAMPILNNAERHGRRAIGHAVRGGTLSMIRIPKAESFTQSSTEVISGEIDADVEHFLAVSDQIPSILIAEVLFGDDDGVANAGGLLIQAMPDTRPESLEKLRRELSTGRLLDGLSRPNADARELLCELFPAARSIEGPTPVRWKCRCSHQRVLAALAMLDPADLAEMSNQKDPVQVDCDFCATHYSVSPEEVGTVFDIVVKSRSVGQKN
jgi:molecular chaperone Hsp33